MDVTTALLVQGCACAPAAHAAMTAAVTSAVNPNVGAPIARDAAPYVEFDTVLEQMEGQVHIPELRHRAESTAAAGSAKRNGHNQRATCTDSEVDIQPAQDDDGDGDEDADGSGSTALRQTMVMAAGSAVTAQIQTPTMRRSMQDQSRLTAAGTDEAMTAKEGRASQPEGADMAMDRMDESTVDRGGRATGGSSAGKAPVRGSVAASAERLTMVTTEEPITVESEQPAEARSTDEQGRVSQQPVDRKPASVDARASQPEGADMAMDRMDESTVDRGGRATGGSSEGKAPVRESVTANTERPVEGRVRTAPQAEPKNAYTRVQERTAAAPQEREAAWPEGRTIVLPDMRGTAESDESPRVAPERLTTAATEEPITMESEQLTQAQSTDEQSRVSRQPVDRKPASVDAHASQPEGAHMATDQANGSTVGAPAGRAPVRGSVAAGTQRLVGHTGRTAARVEPKNAHTPVRIGRDEPGLTGSRGSMDAPITEPGMAPRVQERTAAAPQEREAAWPEGRTIVLPDMRGTAESDESPRVAPERLTTAATEEPITMESEQLTQAQSTDEQSRVSRQPVDRKPASVDAHASQPEGAHMATDQANGSTVGAPAGKAPVRESAAAGTERPVGHTGRTAARVEPKNAHASEQVGRNESGLNGSRGSMDAPVTEPGTAPRVQERTAAATQERETAWPEGRTMVLSDMRGTAASDGSARIAPERLTMVTTEEPITIESEQPAEARSTDEQGRVSQQPVDRKPASVDARASQPEGARMAMDQTNDSTVGAPAGKAPVRESATVGTERPVADTGRTAARVEPRNAHTPVRIGRDEPGLNGSPGSVDVPVREPGTAPRVQERETARSTGRTTVLPEMRGTAHRDANVRVAPERLAMAATEEPRATESEESAEARSTDEQSRVSPRPEDRASASVAARASQPEGAHMATDQANGLTVGRGGRATGGTPADKAPVRKSVTVSTERPVDGRVRTAPQAEPRNAHAFAEVGRDEPALNGSRGSMDAPVTEPGLTPEIVDVARGRAAEAEVAEPRQTALRPTAHRKEGAMTATVESPARRRNLPNPLWDDGLQKAGRRESESNVSPELAVIVGPTRTTAPAEGPDVSQTPQVARPALTEPAGSSVTRQIAAHVSARAALGGGEFRARLVPEHLGSVQIRVRVAGGVCTADIRADDAEVARYIESHSSDLKVSLAEHGIDLSGISVSSRSRAQEGWGAATLSHSEPDWSAPDWNGANARQQYAAAAFAGGSWGHGRGERRGVPTESNLVVSSSHHAAMQSGSPSSDEPIMARWVRGYARIDYLA